MVRGAAQRRELADTHRRSHTYNAYSLKNTKNLAEMCVCECEVAWGRGLKAEAGEECGRERQEGRGRRGVLE